MALVLIVMWVLEAFFYRARSLYPIFRIEPDVILGLVLVVTTPELGLRGRERTLVGRTDRPLCRRLVRREEFAKRHLPMISRAAARPVRTAPSM